MHPRLHSQLNRLGIIDSMLSSNMYPSKEYMIEKIQLDLNTEVSDSTIEKDLIALKTHFKAPIEYSRDNKGYFYSTSFKFSDKLLCHLSKHINFLNSSYVTNGFKSKVLPLYKSNLQSK